MYRLDTTQTTNKLYVCIEGNIGAGKTTLAKELATRTGSVLGDSITLQQEPAEGCNPYLDLYYADPARYALAMQVFLLSKRRRMQLAAQALCLSGTSSVVSDRNYFGDRCFAEVQRMEGYFSEADFNTYLSLHKDMQAELLYPSAFIMLCTPVEMCVERIARRRSEIAGRQCEAGISFDYLIKLQFAISRMMAVMARYTPVMQLNPINSDGTEASTSELADRALRWLSQLPSQYDAWQGVG